MIPALAAKAAVKSLWKSRLGPAVAVAVIALTVVGSLAWQIRSLRIELKEEIRAASDLRAEKTILEADIANLKNRIDEQNRRIRQLRIEAVEASNRAEAAAIRASVSPKAWTDIEKAPAGHQEMNRWFSEFMPQ